MIVHLIRDDKFIDSALREFERSAPGKNRAVLLAAPKQLNYVSSEVSFVNETQAISIVKESDAVVCHGLIKRFYPVLEELPADTPVAWLGWGFDYYSGLLEPAFPNGLLQPQTKNLVEDAKPKKGRAHRLTRAFQHLVSRSGGVDRRRAKIIDRINSFSPVLEAEYDLAVSCQPGFSPDYLPWNYGVAEDDFALGASKALGEDILVGNSATPENNHLEAFAYIAERFDLAGRRIIVPLSYGKQWYRDRVVEEGYRLFGDKFVPLLDFMPKQDYLALMDSCGYVFMNHIRQQAVGNLLIALLKGARIFLNTNNPCHSWLSKEGAVFSSINVGMEEDLMPLREFEKQANSEMVYRCWGRDIQRMKTDKLVAKLLSA